MVVVISIQYPLKKPSATVASLKVTVKELIVTFVTITFLACSAAAGAAWLTNRLSPSASSFPAGAAEQTVASTAISPLPWTHTITEVWQTHLSNVGHSVTDSAPSSPDLYQSDPSPTAIASPASASGTEAVSFDWSHANVWFCLVTDVPPPVLSVHVSIARSRSASTFSSTSKSCRSSRGGELHSDWPEKERKRNACCL